MNEKHENFYRKWIGINQQSKVGPLMMRTFDEKVVLSVAGEVLLELSLDEFENLTANEILEKLEDES